MPGGEILLYQTEDDRSRIEVRMQAETVWLSLNQMAELFQRDKSVISRHIKGISAEGELEREATVANFATVQKEGNREVAREVEYFNLDVIISVGYRVKSHRGTQFRIWATQRLREYLIKGFTLDDERLKQAGGGNYFDELLARIRDIRSSEKVFWRKVLDIYATSIDYDPNADVSQRFFSTVQNKMHWAAHGHTAAEIVHQRADAGLPHMGLTSWAGARPRQEDAEIAKNYLTAVEKHFLETAREVQKLGKGLSRACPKPKA
ncbi:MAG: RhuM family protein [Thermodesulfobacteriota bacterium]